MRPQFVGILLGTLLGATLGNRMRFYDCGRSTSSSCKETATPGGDPGCDHLEDRPQPDLGQIKLSENLTSSHRHPACVTNHLCNRVETESVGDMAHATHRNCCFKDLCNSAMTRTLAPACVLAAAATTLAWMSPGLWSW